MANKIYIGIVSNDANFNGKVLKANDVKGGMSVLVFDEQKPTAFDCGFAMMEYKGAEWVYLFYGYVKETPEGIAIANEEYITCYGKMMSSFDLK